MKKADIGVALYLLSAIVMLIVPISSTLLDVLLGGQVRAVWGRTSVCCGHARV